MNRLEGKKALITGGASGIGAATARRFAAEGATVALADMQEIPADLLAELGSSVASTYVLDVRDEASVEVAVQGVVDSLGQIDILLNAAGVNGYGSAHDLDASEWDRVIDINLKGSFLVSKHALAGMRERQAGNIIHMASVEGISAISMQLAYNASKGAVILMTKNMALDYGVEGIRVNCLCPGLIDTPMTAMLQAPELQVLRERMVELHALKRMGQPEEVANCAVFLASDEASFVTGTALVVDGGWTAGHRLELT